MLHRVLIIAFLIVSQITIADAKPFAMNVRGPLVRMGSYELAFTFTPNGKGNNAAASSGVQIGVQVRLPRQNKLLDHGDLVTANSIEEMLSKPGVTAAEKAELKAYIGLDDKALTELQNLLAGNSDVTMSELERKAEQVLDQLEIPVYRKPPPPQRARKPAANGEQVLDFDSSDDL